MAAGCSAQSAPPCRPQHIEMHDQSNKRHQLLLLVAASTMYSPMLLSIGSHGGGGKMASRSCCGSDGQADARPACLSPGAAAAHTDRDAVHLCTDSMKDQQLVFLTGHTTVILRPSWCRESSADLSLFTGMVYDPNDSRRWTHLILDMLSSISELKQCG